MQNWLKGALIAVISAAVTLAVSQRLREPVGGAGAERRCAAYGGRQA